MFFSLQKQKALCSVLESPFCSLRLSLSAPFASISPRACSVFNLYLVDSPQSLDGSSLCTCWAKLSQQTPWLWAARRWYPRSSLGPVQFSSKEESCGTSKAGCEAKTGKRVWVELCPSNSYIETITPSTSQRDCIRGW